MNKKAIHIALGLFVISSVIFSCQGGESITVTTFQVNEGYGYLIKAKSKVLIKQENIPVIEDVHAFCSESDAEKTGELVKSKIMNHESPSVTREELENMEIDLECFKKQ